MVRRPRDRNPSRSRDLSTGLLSSRNSGRSADMRVVRPIAGAEAGAPDFAFAPSGLRANERAFIKSCARSPQRPGAETIIPVEAGDGAVPPDGVAGRVLALQHELRRNDV